jgi:hypothetical protein
MTDDDTLLHAASADGALFITEIKDRDPAKAIAKRFGSHHIINKDLSSLVISRTAS